MDSPSSPPDAGLLRLALDRPGALLVVLGTGCGLALSAQTGLWLAYGPRQMLPFGLLVLGQALLAVAVLTLLGRTLSRLSRVRARSKTLARRSQRFRAVLDTEIESGRQTRDRLRRTQSDVRTILSMLPDALLRIGQSGEIREYRAGSSPLVGFPRLVAGTNIAQVLPPRASDALLESVDQVIRAGRSQRLEIAHVPVGELAERAYEIRLVPSDGREVLAILRDITVSKTVEELRHQRLAALTRARDTAQEEARSMAALIEELGKARHAALQSARVKSEFLANMSHEIRPPLNGVIGMTDLLLGTALSTEQQEYAETIHSSSESLLSLLNAILDFSKIEAGAVELERAPFSLRRLLKDTLRLFALRAGRKGLQLISRVHAELPDELIGDPTRFRQILTNLVENAIKFTQEGHVSVLVEPTASGDPDRTGVRLSVCDTGLGISEEAQEQIFNAFTQADSSTTRRFGGTGLGLAISHRLAELLGGHLTVESVLGQGCTFHVCVSFEMDEGATGLLPLERLTGCRVLVLAPETPEREALIEMLRELALVPVVSDHPWEALTALHESPVRLAVVDGGLPGGAAPRVAERLCAQDLPTLHLLPSLGQGASRSGDVADAYVVRPLCELDLRYAIERLLAAPPNAMDDTRPLTRLPIREPHSGSLRVLVAEDSEVNQRLMVRLLGKAGHQVVSVWNGQKAIDACEQEEFDVVLMDVQMPVMSGLEATRWIRAMEQDTGKHLPIIAVTAHALAGDAEICLEAGMDAYLSKPIRSQQLLEVLDQFGGGGIASTPPALAPRTTRALKVINVQGMLENVNGDMELLAELAELFIDSSPTLVDDIEIAVRSNDPDAVARAAHKLKGAIGNFQAPIALEAAKRMERIGRERTFEEAQDALGSLREETDRMTEALRALTKAG